MSWTLSFVDEPDKPALSARGLSWGGQIVPYTAIERFVCTDSEFEVVFRDDRERWRFAVQRGNSHRFVDMQIFIETTMLQTRQAVMDESRERVVNAPAFDLRQVRRAVQSAIQHGS